LYIIEKEHSYEKSVSNKYKKVIPDGFFNKVTPQTLAVWFMDDGGKGGNSKYGIVIDCTNYNLHFIHIIQETLLRKFSLKTSLHQSSKKNRNNKVKLFRLKESALRFKSIVKPYIIESMEYKLSHIV